MATARATRFHTDTSGLAALLASRQLRVPLHQRSYAWDSEQLEDFWNDLKSALGANQPEYFLGSVVLTLPQEGSRHTIIDGQQRMATSTMLIAAIRNVLLQRGDSETASLIEQRHLASRDLASLALTPRLILNADGATFFRDLVIDRPSDDRPAPIYKSHRRIADAFTFFSDRVSTYATERGNDWRDALVSWIDFLSANAVVIVVEVADESDAFLIFETLNYRGVPLTVADLLKNYLFGIAGEDLPAVQRSWTAAVDTLEGFANPDLLVSFLRHYWISLHGHVRERDLYRQIKARLRTAADVRMFAANLERSAPSYAALLTPDHDAWGDLGVDARIDVESLLRLRIEQNRPLLLAAMENFEPSELKKLLRYLVAWSVRGIVVGGIGAGKSESAYANAATEVTEGNTTTVAEVYEQLREIIPSDDRFRSSFAGYSPPTNKMARYYLLAFEKARRGDDEPELIPNEDEETVNLEHVLPRSPRQNDWPDFRPDEVREWSGRIGNLVLLRRSANIRLGNRSFATKQPILVASDLIVTRTVGECDVWTKGEIERRAAELAELAVSVWPRRP